MFVPAIKVVDEWEVLREPIDYYPYGKSLDEVHQYQTAKDNVIFEGFEVDNDFSSIVKNSERDFAMPIPLLNKGTIQDLIKYKPTLTKKRFRG